MLHKRFCRNWANILHRKIDILYRYQNIYHWDILRIDFLQAYILFYIEYIR